MNCRHCRTQLELTLIDLGSAPPSNAYLSALALRAPEKWFPLRVLVCQECWLVQTEDFAQADQLFDAEYAYFSGFSTSWLKHCERYAVAAVAEYSLSSKSLVVEVAANDGSLLHYFHERDIPCLGIEPTASTAAAARARGISVVQEFFGVELARRLAREGRQADLMAANNVLAHVPDINDFVAGFTVLLKPHGVATFEFPHLLQLIAGNQFDTIYHEHFSYLSLTAVERIFRGSGLHIFDVEEMPTHGGSLRVSCQRSDTGIHTATSRVNALLQRESEVGMCSANYYLGFQDRAEQVKNDFLSFLLDARKKGLLVAGYGAAAKGNTLLNFAGVRPDLLEFVVDRNPAKQGKWLPGSRIPVVSEEHLRAARPDRVVILPWNIANEVVAQLAYVKDWQGSFVVAVPALQEL
jgi:2-polyprenyl-3-methyl-5-hydroxy-6-metoxy-1,4-benzoquinol methylase